MARHTTRDIRADQVTAGMTVTSHGPITAHRGAETVTQVLAYREDDEDVIEVHGTRPGAWMLRADTTVRIVTDQ